MTSQFKVGDRIYCHHRDLIDTVRGRHATVTKDSGPGSTVYAYVDGINNPSSQGYSFNPSHVELVSSEPTDEEIAALFGIKSDKPCEHCNGTGVAG